MCSPLGLVGAATGINTLDETRERVGGWMGKGRLADKNNKPTEVTNNYYSRTADQAADKPTKDSLKVGKK
tara:strand:- start:317 stop:526 length:210 start_codon:yes stop_codon:yes gene_type:complete